MSEKFDFRKPEDQEEFEKLPESAKKWQINSAQEEAALINGFKDSGLDFADAEKKALMQKQQDELENAIKNNKLSWVILYDFLTPEEGMSSEIQDAVLGFLVKELSSWPPKKDQSTILKIKNNFLITEDKFQEIVLKAVEYNFSSREYEYLDNIAEIQKLVPSIENKFHDIVLGNLFKYLSRGWLDESIKIKNKFSILENELRSPEAQASISRCLTKAKGMWDVIEVRSSFPVAVEEVLKTVANFLPARIRGGKKDKYKYINPKDIISESLKELSLSEEEMRKTVIMTIANLLSDDDINLAVDIKKSLSISEDELQSPEAQSVILEAFFKSLPLDISKAIKITENFPVPKENLHSPEVQQSAFDHVVSRLERSHPFDLLKIKEIFSIPEEKFQSPEIQEAALREALRMLSNNYIDTAIEINSAFSLPKEKLEKKLLELFYEYLRPPKEQYNFRINEALAISNNFSLPEEKLHEIILRTIIENFSSHSSKDNARAIDIKNSFPVPQEMIEGEILKTLSPKLNNPEVRGDFSISEEKLREFMLKKLIDHLSLGKDHSAFNLIREFPILTEELHSLEIQEAAISGIMKNFASNDLDDTIDTAKRFQIPREKFQSPEFQEIVLRAISHNLSYGKIDHAIKIKNNFLVLEEKMENSEIQEIILKLFFEKLSSGDAESIIKIKENFSISGDELQAPEIKKQILNTFLKSLSAGDIDSAIKIRDTFAISEEKAQPQKVQQSTLRELIKKLFRRNAKDAIETKNNSSISKEAISEAATKGIIETLSNDRINDALKIGEEFSISEDEFQFAIRKALEMCLSKKSITIAAKINALLRNPERALKVAYDLLGDFINPKTFYLVKSVLDEMATEEEMKELGISKKGEAGIAQLRERLVKFKTSVLEENFDATLLLESEFYKQYFKLFVRFAESQWGDHGEAAFQKIVKDFLSKNESGKLKALGPEYSSSGEVRITKTDKEAQNSFAYSEQFNSRYGALHRSLQEVWGVISHKSSGKEDGSLSGIADSVDKKIKTILDELTEKLGSIDNPKAKINLTQKIDQLKNLNPRSIRDFQSNFSFLSQFKELEGDLMRSIFLLAIHKHRKREGFFNEVATIASKTKPSFDDVSWMIDFINHTVNEETWRQYFTDDKARKNFLHLVSLKSLEEEMSRAQNQSTKDTTSLEFVPTRGLLMEFSGHIADACWASKYDSIAEKFPNFTSIVMVQNKGTKFERLAGACMLIETEAKDGTPLLVVRGLNPIENLINGVSVADFYKKFIDYIEKLAKKMNRKVGFVMDNHSGGANTNRPVLFNYLNASLQKNGAIVLKSRSETQFNGYAIENSVVSI